MIRTAVTALLLVAGVAVAAPVPKTAPKLEDVYGTSADVSGVKCEMTRAGELHIGVSKDVTVRGGEENRIRPIAGKVMDGDFTLTFRVKHTPTQDAVAARKGDTVVSAGVAVVSDTDSTRSLVVLQRHVKHPKGWKSERWTSAIYPNGGGGSTSYQDKLEDAPLHFRLTREGELFTASTSTDGKEWKVLGLNSVPKFGKVRVGPAVGHNTNADHEAVFDQYELKAATEGKK